jgi:hypothetical protein
LITPAMNGRPAMSLETVTSVRYWGEDEFATSAGAWEELLGRSDADPYFMGWDRQWLWWQHHKALLGGQLSIIACYAGQHLVGIAPFYLKKASHRSLLHAPRMELIGSSFRTPGAVFSEYLDLIADRAHADAVIQAIAQQLQVDDRWSDLVVGNSSITSLAATMVREHLQEGVAVREVDRLESYRVELSGDFASYLASLSSGARRKIWNQRAKLHDPALVVAAPGAVEQVFSLLEGFHEQRWKAPMYSRIGRAFHDDLTSVMLRRGALRMTTLRAAGVPIAAMHNIRLGETEYNIRTGFDATHGGGVSPGYLHFGYCLEAASRDGVRRFDLLGGQGLHRQYKKDFGAADFPLCTFHAIRAPYLKAIYRAYELVRDTGRDRLVP